MKLRVITTDFDIYDKFTKINFTEYIEFPNTPKIRSKLNKIINNINKCDNNIEMTVINNFIRVKRKKHLNFNIYYKN